jgi:hypothetical protein
MSNAQWSMTIPLFLRAGLASTPRTLPDPLLSHSAHTDFIRPPAPSITPPYLTDNAYQRLPTPTNAEPLFTTPHPPCRYDPPVNRPGQLHPHYFKTLSNVSPRTLPPRIDVLTFWMNPSRLRRRSSAASTAGQPDSVGSSKSSPLVGFRSSPLAGFQSSALTGGRMRDERTLVERVIGVATNDHLVSSCCCRGFGEAPPTHGSRKRYCNPIMTDDRFSTLIRSSAPKPSVTAVRKISP